MSLGQGCVAFVLSVLVASTAPGEWAERTALAMGTRLWVSVESETLESATSAVNDALDAAAALESRISTWRPESELSALNAAPVGEPVVVSEELFTLLSTVWHLSALTDGAFDPVVGALVDAWGLRGTGRRPEADALDTAMRSTGRRCFDLRPATVSVSRECEDAWIDAGAFGKGAALVRIARVLAERGVQSARIDFGGQVLVLGADPTASVVEIADPARRSRPAFGWPDVRGSIATSSQSERVFEVDGGRFGHVLDPRTGRPVEAWGSVSVRSDDPLEADVLATALFAMGPQRGTRWLVARPHVDAVFLVSTPGGLRACGSASRVESLVPLGLTDAVSTDRLSDAVLACPGLTPGESP